MWFYVGIEELPPASEEAHDPQHDVPRAGIAGMVTLMVLAVLVCVFNTAVLGAKATGASGPHPSTVSRRSLPATGHACSRGSLP